MKSYANFTTAYVDLLRSVYNNPEHVSSPRGMRVKESLGCSFRITDIRHRLPYVPHREFSLTYMIAEMLWYFSGNNSTDWIANYSSFWRAISDDGKTANSAYGARIFRQHPYQCAGVNTEGSDWTQWRYVKDELTKDPDSRRAVLHIRMPQDGYMSLKDVPCTLSLQFFIRDGALHQVASMRSSDLILGIALDVPAFTLFQELLALELGVKCGHYTHISNSLHIYERDWAKVEKIIEDPWIKECHWRARAMPAMPSPPPLELLSQLEQSFVESTSIEQLGMSVREFCDFTINDAAVEPYWQDWVFILASHRAKKLGDEALRERLIKSTHFSGYSLFNR